MVTEAAHCSGQKSKGRTKVKRDRLREGQDDRKAVSDGSVSSSAEVHERHERRIVQAYELLRKKHRRGPLCCRALVDVSTHSAFE